MNQYADMLARAVIDGGGFKIAPPEQPFKLKSGAKSSFFFNFGDICHAEHLDAIGQCYAGTIVYIGASKFDVIFGPAYKGISLALLASQSLWRIYGIDLPYAHNRKEVKEHGEGGSIIGAQLEAGMRAAVPDDVITKGGAKFETKDILDAFNVIYAATIVGIDRSAPGVIEQVETGTGAPVYSIATLETIKQFVEIPPDPEQ